MRGLLEVSHLSCADAEQTWIAERISEGLAAPRLALIDYRRPTVIYSRRGGENAAVQARAAEIGFHLQHRRSGGGAVLAGPWMLGANLLLPADHPVGQLNHVEAFHWIGNRWQQVLASLGLPAQRAQASTFTTHNARIRDSGLDWVCFAGLSHGELIDPAGRKVLGLAQYRGRWGTLLSAGLLVGETPWEQLEYLHLGHRPERSAMHQLTTAVSPDITQKIRLQLYDHLVHRLQLTLAS